MDDISANAERRQYDRIDKEIVFQYTLFDDLVNARLDEQGLILDIGAGGLRFLSSRVWEKNEQLLMQLDFLGWRLSEDESDPEFTGTDHDGMLVVGIVMWAADTAYEDQFEIGVRFAGRVYRHF